MVVINPRIRFTMFTPGFDRGQPPSLRPLLLAAVFETYSGDADVEYPISHPDQSPAESRALRPVVAAAQRQRRLGSQRELVKVTRPHLGRTVAVPPLSNEDAPDRPLGIGGLVHLAQIAEEAGHAGDLENAADHLRPALEAADALAVPRLA